MNLPKGVLISNIGTPDSFSVPDVDRYLREFLMDEEVVTLPFPLRYALVNFLIVPRRAPASAKKYQAIWTKEGSPLLVNSLNLQQSLSEELGPDYVVELGMRYGNPSIEQALRRFEARGIHDVYVVPLYPQYCRATVESIYKKTDALMVQHNFSFRVHRTKIFWSQHGFIRALKEETEKYLQGKKVDYYLMTYHGLPENQNRKMEPMDSYRQQCLDNSALLADAMGLRSEQWGVSFQSRLGAGAWIKPYTDETLNALPGRGVKNLAILCPSFVSDCLETLEEIGVEGRETFLQAGGESFHLVPCLNRRADYLAELVR